MALALLLSNLCLNVVVSNPPVDLIFDISSKVDFNRNTDRLVK